MSTWRSFRSSWDAICALAPGGGAARTRTGPGGRRSAGRRSRGLALACAALAGLGWTAVASPATAWAAPVEITFWHDWSGEGGKAVQRVVDEFNASQKAVKVNAVLTTGLSQKLLTALAGGMPPDVVLFDRYMTAQFAARGALSPLDAFLAQKGTTVRSDAFFPATWQETVYKGRVYSIPFETNSRVLFYNRSLFEEAGLDPDKPPVTWDDLMLSSQRLTVKDGQGRLTRVGYVPTWDGVSLVHYLWQNGGDVFNQDQTKVTFHGPAGVEALEWVVRFMNQYGNENLAQFASTFGSGNPFYTGKVAMKSEGNWVYGDLRANAPELLQHDLGLAHLPRRKERATIAGGFALVIPTGAKHAQAAWQFVTYAVSQEAQVAFAQGAGSLPARVEAARVIARNPFWAPFVAAMEYAHFRPAHPAFPEIEGLIYKAMAEAVAGTQAPRAALESAASAAQGILDRFNRQFR